MKKGYTLAEVLICVAIIGVLAAILVPLANKFKPDATKAMYVKTYDTLVQVTRDIASNANLYPISKVVDNTKIIDYSKAPLFNLQEVKIGSDSSGQTQIYGGDAAKFCQLLSLAYTTGLDNAGSCSASKVTYSDSSSFNNPSFTTMQGMQYLVGTDTDGTTKYQTDVYVDINGSGGNNCIYNSKECKKPDRFQFIITGDGHVVPADPMGQEYLKTRMNWRKSDVKPDAEWITAVSELPGEWEIAPKVTEIQKEEEPDEPQEPAGSEGNEENGEIGLLPGVACTNYESFGNCLSGTLKIADHDLPQKYNWDDANDQCAALGMRLPTLNELYTIHKAVKDGIVEGTTITEYWTATGYSKNANMAQNGIVGGSSWRKGVQSKSTERQVRCVQ